MHRAQPFGALGLNAPVVPPRAGSRIEALDFVRGLCLLVIAFDHTSSFARKLGYDGREWFTPTMLGYSSAAELFLFVSGALIGILHTRPGVTFAQRFVRLSHRAGHLYLYNALAFVALLAICSIMLPSSLEALGLADHVQRPDDSALSFLLLANSPPLLDILSLYVAYLLVSIVFVPLAQRAAPLAFGLTLGLYLLCQLPAARAALGLHGEGYGLNPFAWQLCFMGGLLCGRLGVLDRLERWMRRPAAAVAVLGALALATVAFVADRKLGLSDAWWWDKHQLGLLRIPHAALVLAAYFWLSAALRDRRMPRPAPALHEVFASMGRHSLEVFTAGILLTYAAALLVGRLDLGTAGYFLTLLCLAAVLWGFSRYLAWRRRVSRSRTAQPAPSR